MNFEIETEGISGSKQKAGKDAGAAAVATAMKLNLRRSQGARDRRQNDFVEGACVAALGALIRFEVFCPTFPLRAVGTWGWNGY